MVIRTLVIMLTDLLMAIDITDGKKSVCFCFDFSTLLL